MGTVIQFSNQSSRNSGSARGPSGELVRVEKRQPVRVVVADSDVVETLADGVETLRQCLGVLSSVANTVDQTRTREFRDWTRSIVSELSSELAELALKLRALQAVD